jgi:hypothetical protein
VEATIMQIPMSEHRLELPPRTRTKLQAFRLRVWMVKLAEGLLAAGCGLMLSYLLVFLLDRIGDTPAWLRLMLLIGGMLGPGIWFPLTCHRWIWRTRRPDQVARLLRHRFPSFADQLLGIIELVASEPEQRRSQALCQAALRQVDAATADYDFRGAVPCPRHRHWAWAAGVPSALALAVLVLVPAAGTNALARWLMPWKAVERYTFAQLTPLPRRMVVPYAEPFSVSVSLADQTAWAPNRAAARYGSQDAIAAQLSGGRYTFLLPPQQEARRLAISVGDARRSLQVQPTNRPELASMVASLKLPDYLQYTSQQTRDIRGGSLSVLEGTEVVLVARATRELADARMDGVPQRLQGAELQTAPLVIDRPASRQFHWRCTLGLSAQEPFRLSIDALEDSPPTLACRQLSAERIVLADEVLSFEVLASDDFGVKMIGMEWEGVADPLHRPGPARGEKVVAAGGPEETAVEATATFSARMEGVSPQTLRLRLFAVDYLPDREPVYSRVFLVHVLGPEDHAIWLTDQMRKWLRGAREVYEEEQRLHATNRELHALPPTELDQPETRHRIEAQAAAESANAGRLTALTGAGEQLIQRAARNDQFNVQTLETWAEMLQALQDIAGNRMPSVVGLLKSAAAAPPSSSGQGDDERASLPSIVDVESGFSEPEEDASPSQDDSSSGSGGLGLPVTIVQGGGPQQQQAEAGPAQQHMEQAVREQEELLEEFARVAEQLQQILENLEGSTFVKRLKAASRRQLEVAADVNRQMLAGFGIRPGQVADELRHSAEKIAAREIAESEKLDVIQQDLEAYYQRVQQSQFVTVLDEMLDTEVASKIHNIGEAAIGNMSGRGDGRGGILGRYTGPMGRAARRPRMTGRHVTGVTRRQFAALDCSGTHEDPGTGNRSARGNASTGTGQARFDRTALSAAVGTAGRHPGGTGRPRRRRHPAHPRGAGRRAAVRSRDRLAQPRRAGDG